MRTVANLVDRLRDRYDFFIVTRNHDGRNDLAPYTDVITSEWNSVAGAEVFYLAPKQISLGFFRTIVGQIKPGLIMLNSSFSRLAILAMLLRRLDNSANVPMIAAPCGEFFPGALSLKPLKKRIYLSAARTFGLFHNLVWKASSEAELAAIRNVIGKEARIFIAPDLPPKALIPYFFAGRKPKKEKGSGRFIFYSRIDRKKNLAFFLRVLGNIKGGHISLDIVGPIEDRKYWEECREVIWQLPSSVTVNVIGGVDYDTGLNKLLESHVFVFPTLSENFGYVILEAMAAGCALLISDRTEWGAVADEGIGEVIPLENSEEWMAAIHSFAEMDGEEFAAVSAKARRYAEDWLHRPEDEAAAVNLIDSVIAEAKTTPDA